MRWWLHCGSGVPHWTRGRFAATSTGCHPFLNRWYFVPGRYAFISGRCAGNLNLDHLINWRSSHIDHHLFLLGDRWSGLKHLNFRNRWLDFVGFLWGFRERSKEQELKCVGNTDVLRCRGCMLRRSDWMDRHLSVSNGSRLQHRLSNNIVVRLVRPFFLSI